MKDIDDLEIKAQIDQITNKINSIIQKVNEAEPQRPLGSNDDGSNQTSLSDG